MYKNYILYVLTLSLISCQLLSFAQSNRNPNLSKKLLQELLDDTIPETVKPMLHDSAYVPPAGAQYTEIRSVDPKTPPVIIDIVGNRDRKKVFKLSDIASSVRYVQLPQPPDTKFTSIFNIISDDEHIFINALEGLFCYSADGKYLYTLNVNELEKSNMGVRVVNGILNNVDLLDGRLIFRTFHWTSLDEGITDIRLNVFDVKELDSRMLSIFQTGEIKKDFVQPQYQRQLSQTKGSGGMSKYLLLDDQSIFNSSTLTGVSIYGDTLCKFTNYDIPSITNPRIVFFWHTYRIAGQAMLQNEYNDTVFQVIPPNQLAPRYVMKWGDYKPDINQYAAGSDLEGKFVLDNWVETSRYIFIGYTEGRSYPIRISQGKVKFHYALYDKTMKTLTHFLTSTIPPMIEAKTGPFSSLLPIPPMIENDIEPVGMPFWPKGVNHNDEMYMIFSKEQIKKYIATGKFKNDKLKAIAGNMPDDGFCIMIVK